MHLFGNPVSSVELAVQSLVAVQAQDFSLTKWGLGVRTGATDSEVELAFREGRILRTHLLRPTWHFVVPADIRWLLTVTGPRVMAASAAQFRKLELTPTVFDRCIKVFRKALKDAPHLAREELRTLLEQAGVVTRGELRMSYILMQAELEAIICSGPREGKQFTYALLDDRAPNARTLRNDDAVVELARRFFATRGPASISDFAKWSWLTLTACRRGLEGCKTELEERMIDGVPFYSAPSAEVLRPPKPVAHLLSIYDEYISSYKDRGAISRPSDGPKLVAMGNALTGIALVDGSIVGSWKRTQRKNDIAVDVMLLRKLSKAERSAVELTALQFANFNYSKLQLTFTNH